MHQPILSSVLVVASITLVSGCATSVPAELPVDVPNAVCSHDFSTSQLSLKPAFTETEKNSVVSGDSPGELLTSLSRSVPNRGIGNTRWNINWVFDTQRGISGCSLANVETNVQIDYHLPLWPGRLASANRTLIDQWNDYSDALRAHHCGHGKIGIDAAVEVKATLQQLPSLGSCTSLQAEADALARSIIDRYKKIEADFTPPQFIDFVQR